MKPGPLSPTPCAPAWDDPPRPDQLAGAYGLRLDTLPPEILLHIASYLGPRATLAFGRLSRRLETILRTPALEPLRLAGRIRWAGTPSAIAPLAHRIAACPRPRRARLWQLLEQQVTCSFHPVLREPVSRLVQWLREAESPEMRLRTRVEALAQTLPSPPPAALIAILDEILACPAAAQPPMLVRWLGSSGWAGCRRRSLSQWQATLQALPAPECAPVLAALTAVTVDEDVPRWVATLSLAMEQAHAVGGQGDTAQRCRLLCAVARALDLPSLSNGTTDTMRVTIWHRLCQAATGPDPALSVPQRKAMLMALARPASVELYGACPGPAPDGACHQTLIGAARQMRLPPPDMADVLCELLSDSHQLVNSSVRMPLILDVLRAMPALPDAERARVMEAVLEHGPHDDPPRYALLWDEAWQLAGTLAEGPRARLLCGLARTLEYVMEPGPAAGLPGDALAVRWQALLDQSIALPLALRPAPVQALALAAALADNAAGADLRMLEAAEEFPDHERARLHLLLLSCPTACVTPQTWRAVVSAVARLAPPLRAAPAEMLVHRLMSEYGEMFEGTSVDPRPDAATLAPGGEDLPAAMWPRSREEGRQKIADLLALLDPGDRWRILLSLARTLTHTHWHPDDAAWLLHQWQTRPRLWRHDVALIYEITYAVARRATPVQAQSLLPQLCEAIVALPPDGQAPALLALARLHARIPELDTLQGWLREAVERLPEPDREALASVLPGGSRHKRKAEAGPE